MPKKLQTVRIQDGDDFRVINQTDYDPAVHTLLDGQAIIPTLPNMSPPSQPAFDLEPVVTPEPAPEPDETAIDPVEEARLNAITIPDDWKELHHKRREVLAVDISGKKHGEISTDEAVEIIENELVRRAGE